MHAFHGCFWGMVEGVWGVSQKTLPSFTGSPKSQMLPPAEVLKNGGFLIPPESHIKNPLVF
jgi:hypothetical protein